MRVAVPRAWNVGGNFLCGWENVADSMAQGRLESDTERTGIDGSEKASGGVGQFTEIVCNRRERSHSKPAASEGSCGGRSEWRAQSIVPRPQRSLFTAESSVAVNKDASELAMTGGAEMERVMSGRKPLQKPRSGWGR